MRIKKIESVSKRLQDIGVIDREATLLDARRLVDAIIKELPATSKYLDARASNVVKAPHFESGIPKVLSGKKFTQTAAEIVVLSRVEASSDAEIDEGVSLSFAEQVLNAGGEPSRSRYIDLRWIPVTSNEVFSRAGLVVTRNRRAMHPTTLETLLFLEYNRALWDPQLVAAAIVQDDRNTRQRCD